MRLTDRLSNHEVLTNLNRVTVECLTTWSSLTEKMVSFDSFDEMYKFARELDKGIKCLEDKLKNPEQLRYGDKKANEKANLCLDTLEEEILNIQVSE